MQKSIYKAKFKRPDVRVGHQETVYQGFYQVHKLTLQQPFAPRFGKRFGTHIIL
jgi:hypothetical protein